MNENKIGFALPKGRLADKIIEILESCGICLDGIKSDTRKLVFETEEFKFFFVKPTDVPTYVEYGTADLGVCGKDTLLEKNKNIYELLDFDTAKCRICVAGYADVDYDKIDTLRVATKYENVAYNYFSSKQKNIEVIPLSGSIELGPLSGLSDVILDIVESGKTLVENGLSVLETVAFCSARLVCNKVSLKTKSEKIRPLVDRISKEIENIKKEKEVKNASNKNI